MDLDRARVSLPAGFFFRASSSTLYDLSKNPSSPSALPLRKIALWLFSFNAIAYGILQIIAKGHYWAGQTLSALSIARFHFSCLIEQAAILE